MLSKSIDICCKSEPNYRMLVENSCDIMFQMDTEGSFTFVSSAWKTVLGHDLGDVVGHSLREFVHQEDISRCESSMLAAIRSGSAQEVTARVQHVGGSWRWHAVRGAPYVDGDGVVTLIGIAHDVTEQLRIEEVMAQTEKMIMVSGLAAGMAHEINNPLGAILQHAQNIERRVSADIPANLKAAAEVGVDLALVHAYLQRRGVFDFIGHIRSAGMRASDIISNMLKFSRRSDAGAEKVDLPALLDRVLELAGTDYDMKKKYNYSRIVLQREYATDLPPVQIVVAELEQVLMNILKNAAQAIATTALERQPIITVRTRLLDGMVAIEVEDNGPGMDEATRLRVFEPFFTTKEVGVGTGLGLSVAYAIVTKGHRGVIEVRSRPGVGSCFTVKLPPQGERNGKL
ncbi:MAG: ATP-binding protein [Desulfuromonadaceae bacterium]|nr:ATP-binding protein [Desulfuromonadaceae bacterium]MDD2847540.1 ATP-binding protein [Desulfuromonadaceae bacterium]MDD4132220.1 ATP-binding protein [Desulfuromonadaceae bacterium]